MNRLKTLTVNGLNAVLPVGLKNSLFHLSFHLARPEFDRFSHEVNFAPNMELGLIAAAGRGLQPQTILDVGAFEGDWSRMARRIWPRGRLVMFEANTRKQTRLDAVAREIGASLCCELLGADDGAEVVFNVMESGSSVLNERSPLDRVVEKRRLRRLDALPLDIAGNILLKIDTQGYELEVLKGAEQLLPRIDAVLLEVAIIEINEGAPLLHEVLAFLKSLGFVTYDILEIHRRPLDRAMNQVDILFVREGSPLIADKRHYA